MTTEDLDLLEQELKEIEGSYALPGTLMTKEHIIFATKAPSRIDVLVKRVRELEGDLAVTKGALNFYKGIIEKCFTTGMTEKEILNELKSSDKE